MMAVKIVILVVFGRTRLVVTLRDFLPSISRKAAFRIRAGQSTLDFRQVEVFISYLREKRAEVQPNSRLIARRAIVLELRVVTFMGVVMIRKPETRGLGICHHKDLLVSDLLGNIASPRIVEIRAASEAVLVRSDYLFVISYSQRRSLKRQPSELVDPVQEMGPPTLELIYVRRGKAKDLSSNG